MATTQLSNLIEPKVFTAYARQKTTLKSALIQTSVLFNTQGYNEQAAQAGAVFEAPHFNPFTWVESNVASDNTGTLSTPQGVNAGSQFVRKDYREQDWSVATLASTVTGSDPMGYIADIVGTYWAQDYQQNVLAKLKGVELSNAANNGSDMIKSVATDSASAITAAESANFNTILDAIQTMGDAMGNLGVIVLHSQVFTNLMKLEPGAFGPISQVAPFGTYYGKTVIIDDTVPVASGTNRKTYTTYILGQGAFGYGEADPVGVAATEIWRNPAAGNGWGEDRLYSRKQLVIHPVGFSCSASVSANAKSPSLAQYGVAAAWTRVFDRKNVPIAILKTNG